MAKWYLEAAPANNNGFGMTGWVAEVSRVHRYGRKYVVLCRKVQTKWGEVIHAAIRNADNSDIPWAAKQWIKNELFGKEALAIEVFPAESRLIDEAGMYHLWVLPEDFKMPFGLHDEELKLVSGKDL